MSVRTRRRPVLLATTALQAAQALMLLGPAYVRPAAAQVAPNARPQGGAVVAGKAGISQTATQTTIAQSSQRAAVDWKSFDVGSGQAVVFQQPNTGSITLNRVTGPDPSQIAGKIQANGQVVIVNQNGVAFSRGSQVDVQSLIISTANVSNSDPEEARSLLDKSRRKWRSRIRGFKDQVLKTHNGAINIYAQSMADDAEQAMGVAASGDVQFHAPSLG